MSVCLCCRTARSPSPWRQDWKKLCISQHGRLKLHFPTTLQHPTNMAPVTSSEANEQCKKCNAVATATCGRCKPAAYCSTACQQFHWLEHKTACDAIRLEKTLYCAGALLEKMVLIWRTGARTLNISSIEDTAQRIAPRRSEV
jgi:hypothetical protein